MSLRIDRHDQVGELHPRVGLVQSAADILQFGRRSLRGETPHLDLGAIEPKFPALYGLADALEAVLDFRNQLLEHRLDGVVTAWRGDRRAARDWNDKLVGT